MIPHFIYIRKAVAKPTIEVTDKIYSIRGQKVMLDFDLALLYNVQTRALKQAVRRNMESFPEDFMFELQPLEIDYLVSQNVIPSKGVWEEQLHLLLQSREYQCFQEY